MSDEQILQEAIRRIRDGFAPERLILFGSRARGQASADADFDFVVLFARAVAVHELAAQIRLALRDLPASFDILVRSQDEWERWSRVPVTLQHAIAREGRTVYDRVA